MRECGLNSINSVAVSCEHGNTTSGSITDRKFLDQLKDYQLLLMVRGSSPGRGWEFFSPIQWVPSALSLGVKRPGPEAHHSPPSSAEVKICGVTRVYPKVSGLNLTKYTLTTINARWEVTQRVMVAYLTRLTHKIAIHLHLVAEICTICSSRSWRPVRKLLDTIMYISTPPIRLHGMVLS
jgi:hypothetical protein